MLNSTEKKNLTLNTTLNLLLADIAVEGSNYTCIRSGCPGFFCVISVFLGCLPADFSGLFYHVTSHQYLARLPINGWSVI